MRSTHDGNGEPPADRGLLDPSDWTAFESAASDVLAAATDKLKRASEGRVWTPTPDRFQDPSDVLPPENGMSPDDLADRLIEVLPYGVGNTHPRFFGWVHGSGSPGNLLADIIASAMNANCGGRDHIGIHIERQVIAWCKTMMGFPDTASGLVVSGTSMASIIAIKTARDAALAYANRQSGMGGARLVGYTSAQAHNCLARAFDLLGLGTDALRRIAVTDEFRMDLDDLARQVAKDRAEGVQPFFLAGTAGTVNTGAIDDLTALSAFAQQEDLWFHVDGAFGASAVLSAQLAPQLSGIERADSLAFDFHKWMHVNYDAGCVLVRDGEKHRRAFINRPDYLAAGRSALAGGEPWPVDFGPELSRGFRALKVWAHLLEHGTTRIAEAIERNCRLAARLGALVEAHPRFELTAPVTLNICCFRFVQEGASATELDQLNARIVERIQLDGVAAPSTTRIKGALCIRVNITNHRTRETDMDLLIESLAEIGAAEAALTR